jgi:hypothetical protein
MFFPLEVKGNYQPGYGITFRLPADFTTPIVFSFEGMDRDNFVWETPPAPPGEFSYSYKFNTDGDSDVEIEHERLEEEHEKIQEEHLRVQEEHQRVQEEQMRVQEEKQSSNMYANVAPWKIRICTIGDHRKWLNIKLSSLRI